MSEDQYYGEDTGDILRDRARLFEALKPFARQSLSTEPKMEMLAAPSLAEQYRRYAAEIEAKDAMILAARDAIECSSCEIEGE